MNRPAIILIMTLSILLVLVWAPWMSAESAGARAIERFDKAWKGVVDGCGFNCSGCGIQDVSRGLIGFTVEIEYACGLIPEDSPAYHQRDRVYVSPLGFVFGMQRP